MTSVLLSLPLADAPDIAAPAIEFSQLWPIIAVFAVAIAS